MRLPSLRQDALPRFKSPPGRRYRTSRTSHSRLQHASAYVSIRQHPYVDETRLHQCCVARGRALSVPPSTPERFSTKSSPLVPAPPVSSLSRRPYVPFLRPLTYHQVFPSSKLATGLFAGNQTQWSCFVGSREPLGSRHTGGNQRAV